MSWVILNEAILSHWCKSFFVSVSPCHLSLFLFLVSSGKTNSMWYLLARRFLPWQWQYCVRTGQQVPRSESKSLLVAFIFHMIDKHVIDFYWNSFALKCIFSFIWNCDSDVHHRNDWDAEKDQPEPGSADYARAVPRRVRLLSQIMDPAWRVSAVFLTGIFA